MFKMKKFDSISAQRENPTKSSIVRIVRSLDVPRMASDTVPALQELFHKVVKTTIHRVVTVAEHTRRRRIDVTCIEFAVKGTTETSRRAERRMAVVAPPSRGFGAPKMMRAANRAIREYKEGMSVSRTAHRYLHAYVYNSVVSICRGARDTNARGTHVLRLDLIVQKTLEWETALGSVSLDAAMVTPVMRPIHAKRVLHTVCRQSVMARDAIDVIINAVSHVAHAVAKKASDLARLGKSRTLSAREVQTAVRMLLPGDLSRHASSEGVKAVCKATQDGRRRSYTSKTAGLVVPLPPLRRMFRMRTSGRVGRTAVVYLAAVSEYVLAEVLEITSRHATSMGRSRVTVQHFLDGVAADEELSKMFDGISLN